ncbi:unnamed protein product [Owenia fusiformis]|uniref:Uncharacterized protein n=1 Tax=Owenia fusiformis TaxID=6347 RepID=A0A8J1TWV6_OWEFU|nr:unnamed protein product [Owenia fusiformis]
MPPTTITTSTPSATSPENISTSSPIDGATTTQDVIKNKEFDERKSENEINKNYITPDTKHKHRSKNNHLKDNVKNTEDIHPAPIQTIDGVTTSKMPSETIATEISKTVTIATVPSTSNQLEITNDSEFKNTQYKEATTSAPTRHVTSATEDTLNVDSLEVNDFEWLPLNWAKCTRPCGEGIKKREVICASKLLQSEVEASKCSSLPAVPNTQPCNVEPCVEWEMSEWSTCSKTCGRGSQEREVTCPIPNMCDDEMKPQTVQLCELQACSRWVSGQWSKCTRTCGGGNQIRHVQCVDNSNNTPTTGCDPQHQPKTSARCNTAACTHHKSAHLNTGKFQCRRNTMSNHICGALKRFGQCQQRYVQLKCCRTCNSHRYHRTKSRLRTRTT